MTPIRILTCVLLTVAVCPAQSRQHLQRLSAEKRIAAFTARMRTETSNPSLMAGLAQAYVDRSRETADSSLVDRAGKLLDAALKLAPGHYESLQVQNAVDLMHHRFPTVAARARELVVRQPKDAVNFAVLGDALMEMGQYDDAAEAYQQMVNLRPDLMSFNRIGWFRFVTGDMEGAIEMMGRAVKAGRPGEESTAWCLTELGNLYLKAGRVADAGAVFQAALQHFAGSHAAHAGLGKVAEASGNQSAAVAAYRRAQSIVPMIEYAAALAALHTKDEKPQQAREQWKLIDTIATLERAYGQKANRQLGLIYADQNRNLPQALEAVRADLEVRKDVYTWDAYAWVLFRMGRVTEAAEALRNALKWNTPEPLFREHAAAIREALAAGTASAGIPR
ncbi:MAG: tetratricopeptide repeat protein [Bryobacteraceae bacterium]|nr:tetratricopeptide repeat protein [Bryobacteraceae bacterium]